jgi:energy-coupling factor transport system ATP-binding protein
VQYVDVREKSDKRVFPHRVFSVVARPLPSSFLLVGRAGRPFLSATLKMISLDKVCFSYSASGKPVFRGLSLEIEKGSWIVMAGPDGSGKTTLCKLVKGLLKPTSGSLTFDNSRGQDGVGYLGGDPYDSLVGISVAEDVIFGLENLNLSQPEMETRFKRALRWTGLSGMEERLVHTLSGGEQQKLALAGALAEGSDVLVIDEALNMLDKAARRMTLDLIDSLRKDRGLTILEAASACFQPRADRIIFLLGGEIVSDSSPDAFAASELGSRWVGLMGGETVLRRWVAAALGGVSTLDEETKDSETLKCSS